MSEPDAPSAIDSLRLIAEVRAGDPAAIDRAYRMTFGNDLGRLVLAHHLTECGVGNPLAQKLDNLEYAAGQHDAALTLARNAHFGQASVAVAVLSDELHEERISDEPAYYPNDLPEDDS